MDHKEMSRRILAIVSAWGFWLFWVITGIACLTTHEIERYRIVRDYDGRYPKPEYDQTGFAVAVFVWLFVSLFPMVFEQWKNGKVRGHSALEFTLIVLVAIACGILSGVGNVVLSGLLVMAGVTYSCFRLRQAGLNYLAPVTGES